jgi:hypothetical protein
MSHLQALQQQLLKAVLEGGVPRARVLCSDARASAASRLAVYQQGYRIRLREALTTEFPGLGLMAGPRFAGLLDQYVAAHPSAHYNIRWHGAGLAAFLEYALPWRSKPALADMAALDWAISTVFDASDEARIGPAQLADVPAAAWAGLSLHPQPSLQMLAVQHNVEVFRGAADQESSRPRLRRYATPRHLLVWRDDQTVRYRVLEADERAALAGAMLGESFALLCDRLAVFHDAQTALPRLAAMLHQWLDSGLLAGYSVPD